MEENNVGSGTCAQMGVWNAQKEIEQILERIKEAGKEERLDHSCIFDLIMLYLRKQVEIFGIPCILVISPKNFFYQILEPAWRDWAERNAIFADDFPWEKLPNRTTAADYYFNEMPAVGMHPTLADFFSLNRNNPQKIKGNWFRYFERRICAKSLPVLKKEKEKLCVLFEFSQEIWNRICRLKYPDLIRV